MSTKGIGENIKKILEEQNKNVSWLAEKLNISKQGLYKTLKQENFNTSTLQNIADALSVNILDLFEHPISKSTWDKTNLEPVKNKKWPSDFHFEGSNFTKTFMLEIGNPEFSVLFDAVYSVIQNENSLSKKDIIMILQSAIEKAMEQEQYVNVLQPKSNQ